ncbi:MAG TPA: hypothetical protein VHE12_00960 [bacterium]|nr:hypothetical protein [bacterium]
MSSKTGWLEKYKDGRVISMVEVKYHRVKLKKTARRKKGQAPPARNHRDESLYYVLDKKVSYGELSLTASSVFTQNEIIELELFVARHQAKLRVLARARDTQTFMELRRPMFRAQVHFAAVNKHDFENVKALEEQRLREEAAAPVFNPASKPVPNSMKLTFKKS